MFKIAKPDELYPTELAIRVPTEDGHIEQSMTVSLRCLPYDKAIALTLEGDAAFARKVVGGWPDGTIQDADGSALPFSAGALKHVAQIPYWASAVAVAYFQRFGRRKNS